MNDIKFLLDALKVTIEHADYLADDANTFLNALLQLETAGADSDSIDDIKASVSNSFSNLRNSIFEYQKRREACLS